MLVIKIELHSAITRKVTEIGRMVICNDGMGTRTKGDYTADVIRKPTAKGLDWDDQMDDTLRDITRSTRRSRVENYSRLSRPVWDLVALALKNMGYGK